MLDSVSMSSASAAIGPVRRPARRGLADPVGTIASNRDVAMNCGADGDSPISASTAITGERCAEHGRDPTGRPGCVIGSTEDWSFRVRR